MGLLDSVLGAVAGANNNARPGGDAGLGGLLGNLLGGQGQGVAGGLAALAPVVLGMLANNGGQGGLAGMAQKFQQAGLGDKMSSWIGSGANAEVSGEEMTQALGEDTVADVAGRLGVSQGEAAGSLAQVLPGLIDKLTPQGQAPQGGLGNTEDLMGMLSGLLRR